MRRIIWGLFVLALVGLTASPALAGDEKPLDAADPKATKAIMRLIKRAERAGYERHDKKRYFQAFTKDAEWTRGRRPVAGEYDLTWNRAEFERYRSLQWDVPPSGRDRMFFHDEEVQVEGDKAQVELELRRSFFGGDGVDGVRYELVKTRKGWRIAKRREWPKTEIMGVEHFRYDDEGWLVLDEELAVKDGEKAITGLARTVALVRALRYQEAYELAKALSQKKNAEGKYDLQAITAYAALAVEVKRIDEAIEVIKAARALDPSVQAPMKLRHLMPRTLK